MENNTENTTADNLSTVQKRLDDALKTYKISEIYANDVFDDYGKKKIASLRLEFAKHELLQAMDEASRLGIENENSKRIQQIFMEK